MFTGIVEELGTVSAIKKAANSMELTIQSQKDIRRHSLR